MDILLLRCGNRALILPRNQDVMDCPLLVRLWLGMPYSEDLTEITADKPLPGISAPVILATLLENGYCALGINMGVRNLAVFGPLQVNRADGGTTDLLREDGAPPGNPRGG